MHTGITLNWDRDDPKAVYSRQLSEYPLYWDKDANSWVAYSYKYCNAILSNPDAHIPEPVITTDSLLNEKVRLLVGNFARLSNGDRHTEARNAAMMVYKYMQSVSVPQLMETLLKDINPNSGFNYVEVIGKKLPVLVILKGFGFSDHECKYVTQHIATLVKIMTSVKDEDTTAINAVVDEFYAISERYIIANRLAIDHNLTTENCIQQFICNLVGLFIQSYDAGRALLCNTLLNTLDPDRGQGLNTPGSYRNLVIETLRLDAPVHNTRRIAVNDILMGDQVIKASQKILITIAAANLDPRVFKNPLLFDPSRSNNAEHLTFGLGEHACLAKHLMIDIAAEACSYLKNKYPHISIPQQEFKYEPQANVRMIRELMVKLS